MLLSSRKAEEAKWKQVLAGGNTEGNAAPAACWEMQHFFFSLISTPSLPVSISSCSTEDSQFVHTACTAYTHTHTHTHKHTRCLPIACFCPQFHSFQEAFLHFRYLFLSLSQPHTLIHSLIHSPISISFIFALPLCLLPAPLLPSLHLRTYLTFICKWREDLTVEYVEKMWFPSQVGNSSGT